MKKTLLSLFVGAIAFTAFGQSNNQIQVLDQTIKFDKTYEFNNVAKGTTTCSTDTVDYTLAKATGLAALSLNNATSAQALGQYFNAPQSLTLHGATFYAYKTDATGGITQTIGIEVYLAGPDSMPTGAALTSTTITVDTTFEGGSLAVLEKTVNFSAPIAVSQPYVIVISNPSPNSIGVVCNSYTAGDGAQEWLCGVDLFGTWTRPYLVAVGPSNFDADMLIHPMVSYDITIEFTVDNCLTGPGGSVSFTNTSSPILNDRMYSQAAFVGNTDTSYIYDFGDASGLVYEENPSHIYAVNQAYSVTMGAGIQGWRTFCVEQHTAPVDMCTGIDEANENDLVIYPNPVNDVLTIKGLTNNSIITVFDVAGKIILTENCTSNIHTVSTDGLTSGIYYVKIIDEANTSKAYKIVKE